MSQLDTPNKSTTVRSLFTGLQLVSPALAAQLAAAAMFRTQRGRAAGWERELLETGTELRVEGPSGGIAARRWGEVGPLVLLVHGWNGRGSQLGAFVAPLVATGHQVVAFDAPGHGRSYGSRSSLLEFANAFDAVLDTVRPFFQPLRGVVAHSMGGAAVTYALSRAQARGRAVSEPGAGEPRLVFIAPPTDVRGFVDTVSGQLGLLPQTQARLESLLERRIGQRLEDLHALKLAGAMRQPLLVVHDEQDRAVPFECGQSLAAAWPGAELYPTRGLGHSRILRDAGVISATTGFISGTRAVATVQ
jgi:pimeloyl-ACP methyl ester carboxylesterase